MTRTQLLAAAGVLILLVSGCAERGLASGPASPPGAGSWAAVGVAAGAAALVLAALILFPVRGNRGSAVAATVLALQAGAAVVGSAVLAGAAVRSAQLVTRPPGAEQAASLLRLTGLDGREAAFFYLMAGTTVVLGSLLVVVLVLATRFAAGVDPTERTMSCALLGLEAGVSGVALALLVRGDHSLPVVLTAAALPLFIAAAVTCRPQRL